VPAAPLGSGGWRLGISRAFLQGSRFQAGPFLLRVFRASRCRMKKLAGILAALCALAVAAALVWLVRGGGLPSDPDAGVVFDAAGGHWPGWRGPGGTGLAREAAGADIAFESARVLWKAEVDGWGNASPVVWGDRVFIASAVGGPASLRRTLVSAVDRADGRLVWTAVVPVLRRPLRPPAEQNGWATPTPACNGRRLAVLFGTGTLACLGLNGAVAWTLDLGPIDHLWGLAASPAMDDRRVYVAVDQGRESSAPSFVAAIDLVTGVPAWRAEIAPSGGRGYSSPLLLRDGTAPAVVLWAGDRLAAFDAGSGRRVWEVPTFAEIEPIATPLPVGDLLVLHQSDRAMAWRAGPAGAALAWARVAADGARFARIAASVAVGGRLYGVTEQGGAVCHDAAAGTLLWTGKLGGAFFAAPVAAGGRVLFTERNGTIHVLKAGDRFEPTGALRPGGRTDASPAVAGGRLYLRTRSDAVGTILWCLGAGAGR